MPTSADTNSESLCPVPEESFENNIVSETHAVVTADDVPVLDFVLVSYKPKNLPNRTLVEVPVEGG